jgi:hypothetical protein
MTTDLRMGVRSRRRSDLRIADLRDLNVKKKPTTISLALPKVEF